MILVATAVVASKAFFLVSFFGKSLSKCLLCCLAVGHTACPAFAVLRHVTWSQTIETQSELLDMLSCIYFP